MLRARSLFIHVIGPFAMTLAGHQPWWPPLQCLHKDTLLSAAHFLSQELDPLGIKVSTVSIGPSAPAKASSQITHAEARCAFCSRCRTLLSMQPWPQLCAVCGSQPGHCRYAQASLDVSVPMCFIEDRRSPVEHSKDDRGRVEPLYRRPRGGMANRTEHNPLPVSAARKDCFSSR